MSSKDNIKVAVRVRPFNSKIERERDPNVKCIVDMTPGMENAITYIHNPQDPDAEPREYAYNYSYWSHNPSDEHFASQKHVFETLGYLVLDNCLTGYNSTLFAYGQSGAGKSFSMVGGDGEHRGIVPRVCEEIFSRCDTLKAEGKIEYEVIMTMVQIYMEKLSDLLVSSRQEQNEKQIRVTHDKRKGTYVFGANSVQVTSYEEIMQNLDQGMKMRIIASTALNSESSRAHTVMTVFFKMVDKASGKTTEAKINLVDLAGSERVSKAETEGVTRAEGAKINLSLMTLGRVIRALAEGKRPSFRDSKLTEMLQESLGSNSKTIMIAAISPADINYEESVSTLEFARTVSSVKVSAIKQEMSAQDSKKAAAEASAEVKRLQEELSKKDRLAQDQVAALQAQLEEQMKLFDEMRSSFDERRQNALILKDRRSAFLKDLGLSGEELPPDVPRVVNMSEDTSIDGKMVYPIVLGETVVVGRIDNEKDTQDHAQIVLDGSQVAMQHCKFTNPDGEAFVVPLTDDERFETTVNGKKITKRTKLTQGSRIWIGSSFVFRFEDPRKPALNYEVDYKMAYKELLKSQGYRDPEEVQREVNEEKEKIKRDLEKKMQDVQDQEKIRFEDEKKRLQEEHRRKLAGLQGGDALLQAEEEFERKQKDLLEQQNALEMRLKAALEREVAEEEERAREEIKKIRLENELTFLLPMIQQAKIYSSDLKRPVDFEGVVRRRLEDAGEGISAAEGQVMVKVLKKWNNTVSYWDKQTFEDRFASMEELYTNVQDAFRKGQPLDVPLDEDPFISLSQEFQLIGQGFVFLAPLSYGIGIADTEEDEEDSFVEIMSEDRGACGRLSVKIMVDAEGDLGGDTDEEVDAEDMKKLDIGTSLNVEVTIAEAEGIPANVANDVHCKYHLYNQREVTTPCLSGTRVVWNSTSSFRFKVTPSLLDFFDEKFLLVNVYGCGKTSSLPEPLHLDQLDRDKIVAQKKVDHKALHEKAISHIRGDSSTGKENEALLAEVKRLQGLLEGKGDMAAVLAKESAEKLSLQNKLQAVRAALQKKEQEIADLRAGRGGSNAGEGPSGVQSQEHYEKRIRELQAQLDQKGGGSCSVM